MDFLRVAGAQLNLVVGDLDGNYEKIARSMAWAEEEAADVLLLPELAITGYPPEDLLIRPAFVEANLDVVRRLAAASGDVVTVVGFADRVGPETEVLEDAVVRTVANAAALLYRGEIRGVYHKVLLPNYGVFDEDRYFVPGREPARIWDIGGVPVGVSVCEDIWVPDGPPTHQASAGARVLLNINASPYHTNKAEERAAMLADRASRSQVPVVYLNLVGGQDELVFEGDSMVFEAGGSLLYRAPEFREERFAVDVPIDAVHPPKGAVVTVRRELLAERVPQPVPVPVPRLEPEEAEVYEALVLGLRDYVRKNGFQRVVIGLSGGIDSAVTAAVAVDALGADSVWGITMPTRFSSEGSVRDAADLAERLGIRFDTIPIDETFAEFLTALDPAFAGTDFGIAEENLQARIRGAILMALSNKFGHMVVTTGNKSEVAVGYATLYGDMAGGYSVLKDVFKTLVYRLAEWRNTRSEVIPPSTISKPPSAELRPDQKDSDSLPPYDLLDQVLTGYVEEDRSVADIVADGFDADLVRRVARLVDQNEYKRRQAAPGVRITRKAFGKDRRLPITNRYREG
jgi:NAD+ synthase (glutamine-hydrolysing)